MRSQAIERLKSETRELHQVAVLREVEEAVNDFELGKNSWRIVNYGRLLLLTLKKLNYE